MNEAERALVRISGVLGARRRDRLGPALDAAAAVAAPAAIEETLLQSYLFLGYPAALQAMAEWRERRRDVAVAKPDDAGEWAARGARVCERVYGGTYERLRANVARLHPDLERWMVVEGYGKVLGRPGLELATRELCIVALLVGQDAPQQLHAHLQGALNVGASATSVSDAVELAAAETTPERRDAARSIWNALQARRAAAETPGGSRAES